MAWWNNVASLAPVAAWDALHVSEGQLQDQVGSNAITVQGGVATPFPYYGLFGEDRPWPLATPLSLSGDGVLMGFVMHVSPALMFYKDLGDSSSYFLNQESNGAIYQYAQGSGGQVGIGPAWGVPKFMALVFSPTAARAYINDDWAGEAFDRAWVADTLGGVGYLADGNGYNIGSNERFFAAGWWSGTASLADLRALEAACRAELKGPPVGIHSAALSRLHSPSSDQWNQPGNHPHQYRGLVSTRRNIHFGGNGQITGTVKEKGQPDQPLIRQVLLLSENTHTLVASTWSQADGTYRFERIDPRQRYTVISTDHQQLYRAVIADKLTPLIVQDQMP